MANASGARTRRLPRPFRWPLLTPSAETSEAGWRTAARLQGALLADTPDEVRDVLTALVLAEAVYKRPESEVAQKAADFKARAVLLLPLQEQHALCPSPHSRFS